MFNLSTRLFRHRLPDRSEALLVRVRGRPTEIADRVAAKAGDVNAPILFQMQFHIADLELIRSAMRSQFARKRRRRLDEIVDELEQQIFHLGLQLFVARR